MKNVKKDSGISYSNIAIVLILVALIYGTYQKVSESPTDLRSVDQAEQDTSANDDVDFLEKAGPQPQQKIVDKSVEREEASDLVTEEVPAPTEESVQVKAPQAWSSADFKNLMKRTQSELPVSADFKKLSPKEVHHTPELLNRAGVKLGLIAEVLDGNPDFAPIAQEFYQDCLIRKDLPTSIRALCLANHRNLRVSYGDSPDWHDEEIKNTTIEIRELAEHIPLK